MKPALRIDAAHINSQVAVRMATHTGENILSRFLGFLKLVFVLVAIMFSTWYLSARFLPQGILRSFFANRFSTVVGEFTFLRIFLANFLIGFLGVQFMNLFRVGNYPGGLYILPVFWIIYGLLLGTNSFVFAEEPIAFSVSILWERTGFNELLAYTLGYEASRNWALWEQQGLWRVSRLKGKRWNPQVQDVFYWCAGLIFLLISVVREIA